MGFILFFNLFLLHSWQHFFQLLFSCSCAQHRETPVVQQQVMPHAQGCWRHASASTPAMGILFPLGKEVLPLINQAEVCLLLQRTTANKALRKGGVVRAYLFKKKKNLQVLLLHVLRLVRMGGRPCSAERDLLPITLWHC